MIVNQGSFKKSIRSLALRVFSRVENNGNCNFNTNGEKVFVKSLIEFFNKHFYDQIIMFDVGANTGEYTKMLLDNSIHLNKGASIHVFEPTGSCYQILEERFADCNRVILNKKAVSNDRRTACIYYDKPLSGLASLYKRNLDSFLIEMNQSEIVETIRLDDYIENSGVGHIHFVKIDIEGHEMAAFEGLGAYMRGDFIDFIQFEYGGANLDAHTSLMELYALFEKAGFLLAKVMPKGLDIRPYRPWMDNFQCANYVAISKKAAEKIQ